MFFRLFLSFYPVLLCGVPWKTEFNLCQNISTKDADVVDPEIQDPEQIELQENLVVSTNSYS